MWIVNSVLVYAGVRKKRETFVINNLAVWMHNESLIILSSVRCETRVSAIYRSLVHIYMCMYNLSVSWLNNLLIPHVTCVLQPLSSNPFAAFVYINIAINYKVRSFPRELSRILKDNINLDAFFRLQELFNL